MIGFQPAVGGPEVPACEVLGTPAAALVGPGMPQALLDRPCPGGLQVAGAQGGEAVLVTGGQVLGRVQPQVLAAGQALVTGREQGPVFLLTYGVHGLGQVARVTKRTGRAPGTVTADRGYGEKRVDDALHDLGVRTVALPAKANPASPASRGTPAQRSDEVKWRNGSEGRISTLKRGYGWDRTRIDGTEGARIWTGHAVLTHNLIKISALAA